jgi:hypothetical protein
MVAGAGPSPKTSCVALKCNGQRSHCVASSATCANSDALEHSTALIDSPDFAFKGGPGVVSSAPTCLSRSTSGLLLLIEAENNAIDPAMKILAVTFKGVLRTVRWRPQPDRSRSRLVPGPARSSGCRVAQVADAIVICLDALVLPLDERSYIGRQVLLERCFISGLCGIFATLSRAPMVLS